jgi:hypothetical protein
MIAKEGSYSSNVLHFRLHRINICASKKATSVSKSVQSDFYNVAHTYLVFTAIGLSITMAKLLYPKDLWGGGIGSNGFHIK